MTQDRDNQDQIKPRDPSNGFGRSILYGAQVVGGLFDALCRVRHILEQLSAKFRIDRGGFAHRADRQIEVAESHGQVVPHLVSDDARLAGVLPRRFGRRQTPARAWGGVKRPEAEPRELENEPLAAAALDATGWWTGGTRPHGGDTPASRPVEAAADPATARDDRRAPLPQRGIEIERGGLARRVGHAARERGNGGAG